MVSVLNIVGLVLSLSGVIILFRYGMPYKVRSGGFDTIVIEQTNKEEVIRERRYDFLGICGLVLIILGTALQIVANVI
ncbi:hypothetical protein LB535_25140 [Mesorhizobium sp. CA10]|uniref:hypothetical protein n=1 Tax=Mesorhizobium sp. CA10 TaxID=588495 RepID=UPI001CC9F3DA|nr:hypothetical protein [Mesorhizobium sp. CA10]MBZ9885630.1 hypothetical protein [Mesorhizobium sp. CA10]